MRQAWFWWNSELETTWDDPRQGAPHTMPTELDRPSWWLPHTALSVTHIEKPRSPSPFEGLGVPRLTSDAEREAAEQQKTLCLQSDPQDQVELSATLNALKSDGALGADSIDLADSECQADIEPVPKHEDIPDKTEVGDFILSADDSSLSEKSRRGCAGTFVAELLPAGRRGW